MRNHRRAGLAALAAIFLLASLIGSAGAQEDDQRQRGTDQRATLSGAQLPPAGIVATGKTRQPQDVWSHGGHGHASGVGRSGL